MRDLLPFAIGGLSGMTATSLVHPIDTFKVQVQIASEKIGKVAKLRFFSIISAIRIEFGLQVLYRGMGSALLRQVFYTSTRFGSYTWAKNSLKTESSHLTKVALSVGSGVLGAIVGNPFDVVLVRKQAHFAMSPLTTFAALKTIIEEEGFLGLWRGLCVTICRVVIINVGQLAIKDIIADQMKLANVPKSFQDNFSAGMASLITSFLSLPVDNVKVKLQKQLKGGEVYAGIWDCLQQTVKKEGLLRLWVGLPIYLLRGAPHSFILIRTQQYLTQMFASARH